MYRYANLKFSIAQSECNSKIYLVSDSHELIENYADVGCSPRGKLGVVDCVVGACWVLVDWVLVDCWLLVAWLSVACWLLVDCVVGIMRLGVCVGGICVGRTG